MGEGGKGEEGQSYCFEVETKSFLFVPMLIICFTSFLVPDDDDVVVVVVVVVLLWLLQFLRRVRT